MKFVVFSEKDKQHKVVWSWRLETDAGTVLANCTRKFDNPDKCSNEIFDIKKDASITKIVKKA